MDLEVRQLTLEEAAVVRREFTSEARGMKVLGWSCIVFALVFAGFVPFALAKGDWLIAICAVAPVVPLVLLASTVLSGSRRRAGEGVPTLRAERLEALCQSRKEGSGSRANWVNYIGSYRVGLRAGWDAFWPEGKVVEVELCFPEGFGPTHFSAAVVSLPGIDIARWLRRRPPSRTLFAWLLAWTLVGGILTLIGLLELPRSERLEEAAGWVRERAEPLRVTSLRELIDDPVDSWHTPAVLATAHRVLVEQGAVLCATSPEAEDGAGAALNQSSCVPEYDLAGERVQGPVELGAVSNVSGVLVDAERWVSGTPGVSQSLVWLVAAFGFTSLASGLAAVTLQRRYKRDLQRWAEAIRRDGLEP